VTPDLNVNYDSSARCIEKDSNANLNQRGAAIVEI
jgi:hypothetical protein